MVSFSILIFYFSRCLEFRDEGVGSGTENGEDRNGETERWSDVPERATQRKEKADEMSIRGKFQRYLQRTACVGRHKKSGCHV